MLEAGSLYQQRVRKAACENTRARKSALEIKLVIRVFLDGDVLDHIEPASAAKLRSALAAVLEAEFLVIRNHILMSNERSLVSHILLSKSVKIRLHKRRAETFALERRQDGERVDRHGTAFLLVS